MTLILSGLTGLSIACRIRGLLLTHARRLSMFLGRRFFVALTLVLASCAQPQEAAQCWALGETAAADVDAVAQEEPGAARRFWRSENEQATALAGNVTVSIDAEDASVFAFADGATLRARAVGVCEGGAPVGSETMAGILGAPEPVRINLYEVIEERVSSSALRGGLCGEHPTRILAASEFVDDSEAWVLRVASFQGTFTPETAGEGLKACFSFDYVQPH